MSLNYYRRSPPQPRLSGGITLRVPKTPAESLALYLKLRQLKADFLRRQQHAHAHHDDD